MWKQDCYYAIVWSDKGKVTSNKFVIFRKFIHLQVKRNHWLFLTSKCSLVLKYGNNLISAIEIYHPCNVQSF